MHWVLFRAFCILLCFSEFPVFCEGLSSFDLIDIVKILQTQNLKADIMWTLSANLINLGFLIYLPNIVDSASMDNKNIIHVDNKELFKQFRENVLPLLEVDFMKTDTYLWATLRFCDFNITAAEEMVKKNLAWRKQNNLDGILNKTSNQIQSGLPFKIDSSDNHSNPVAKMEVTESVLLESIRSDTHLEQIMQSLQIIMETMSQEVMKRESQENKWTQWKIVANAETFQKQKKGCGTCTIVWMNLVYMAEKYYTGMIQEFTIFEVPSNAAKLADIMECYVSSNSGITVTVYGGKHQYKKDKNKRNRFGCKQRLKRDSTMFRQTEK